MLAYQHAYHAGNLADVHKHSLLAVALEYMGQKDKPLSYIETHAGRALYDLGGAEAAKTGEAARGIGTAEAWFGADHPYRRVLDAARADAGAQAYPGSPYIARYAARDEDKMTLAELHPAEAEALRVALPGVNIRQMDGPEMALSITPPTPRRGLMLVDPSYEIKSDYDAMPKLLTQVHRKWGVGVLMLWYPILANGAERGMVRNLGGYGAEKTLHHRVHFPPAKAGHGMIGSGMFVVNPPWGLQAACAELDRHFAKLGRS